MSLVDSITGGISRAIHTMFGSGISTYTDTVKQGLTARGFHIRLLDASRTPEINGRERRDHPFDVRYFPETDDMSELYAVSERLYLALEFIETEQYGVLHGTDMHFEIVDNVLHFFVNYNFGVRRISQDSELMQELSTKGMINSDNERRK